MKENWRFYSWNEYCDAVRSAPDWKTTQQLMRSHHVFSNSGHVLATTTDYREKRASVIVPRSAEWRPKLRSRRVYGPPRENQKALQAKRKMLLRRDPHCFWCGSLVGDTLQETSNMATIDHLYSRLHPFREHRYRETRAVLHVLACNACNQERAAAELGNVPFIPKLTERLEYAQLACAVNPVDVAIPMSAPVKEHTHEQRPPKRAICTIEEALAFAREHPER